MLLASEYTTERQIGAHFALVCTVDDIHREMDRLAETADPEYCIWQGDQGLLPLEEVKRQVGIFGTKVLPHYQESAKRRSPMDFDYTSAEEAFRQELRTWLAANRPEGYGP